LGEVCPAVQTESGAVLAAKRAKRKGKQNVLPHHGQEVDLIVFYLICLSVMHCGLVDLIELDLHEFT
jgi:hypothetical protein